MFNPPKIAGDQQGIVSMNKFVILMLENILFLLKYLCKKRGSTEILIDKEILI